MRWSDLMVALILLSVLAACRKDDVDSASPTQGHEPGVEAAAVVTPPVLVGTPWGDIIELKAGLWSLLDAGRDDPDELLPRMDSWYGDKSAEIQAACAAVSRRQLRDPDSCLEQTEAFANWQREVALPRIDSQRQSDARLLEQIQRFEQLCLQAASEVTTTLRNDPEDPWSRYVALRQEIHALLGSGLSKAAKTRRKGEAWYADHEEEIRATCRRMSALADAAGVEERIEVYTTYLRTEGQRTIEMLVAKIPAMVSDPGEARRLFDMVTRFDKICADATADLL